MGRELATSGDSTLETVTNLAELSRIDNLYGDLYLRRAKDLLHERMPLNIYQGLLRMEMELNNLPNRIHNAMMQGKWTDVREMSAQMQSMKQSVGESGSLLSMAKLLHEHEDIPIDPFSPGMQQLAGKSVKELPVLRDKGMRVLSALVEADREWKDLYLRRRGDLEREATLKVVDVAGGERTSPEKLRQQAEEALAKGNFDRLGELAGALAEKKGDDLPETYANDVKAQAATTHERFDVEFSPDILSRAESLGLAAARAESRYCDFASLAPFIWHPTFADLDTEQGRALRLSALPLAAYTPEPLRSRIEMFVLHPFVNSAGVRFLPPLVDEDVLVEDFPEPAAESALPVSPLLEALGLDRRNSLTRLQIERALGQNGYRVVKEELRLDPCEFRLVCIPPDLHLRIGINRGWGTEAIWTHFDGYMLTADGKMHALAGGDVRFGGIYDMVGISRNYESDRIIVRFAVVQRRRMGRPQRR